jgi:small-conductance mechanosensitive channel
MVEKTDILRSNLDAKKNGLKEKIQTMVTELKNKTDAYSEVKDKPENEKEEGEEEVPRDEKMEELIDLFQKTDFNSDLEKITEVLDDRISKLRDQLETARSQSTENYFNNLNTNDYYRNKKRIDDIQEIYNIYWDKIQKEINNVNKPKKEEENK